MTEVEAKKILDFLCRRWEKNIRHYVDARTIENVSIAKVVLEEERNIRISPTTVIQFQQVIAAKINTMKADGSHRSFSLAFTIEETGKEPMHWLSLKTNDGRCSCSRILKRMLDVAENANVNLHVFAFVHRSETLEELRVEADLEDISVQEI